MGKVQRQSCEVAPAFAAGSTTTSTYIQRPMITPAGRELASGMGHGWPAVLPPTFSHCCAGRRLIQRSFIVASARIAPVATAAWIMPR